MNEVFLTYTDSVISVKAPFSWGANDDYKAMDGRFNWTTKEWEIPIEYESQLMSVLDNHFGYKVPQKPVVAKNKEMDKLPINSGDTFSFTNSLFGEIRCGVIDGKPFAVASDVAKALGYKRPGDAVIAHCNDSVKYRIVDSQGRSQETNIIFEPDIYRLIFRSNLEKAKEFERWVVEEVLPEIRKNGSYAVKELSLEERTLNVIGDLQKLVAEAQSEAELYRDFFLTEQLLTIDETAKLLDNKYPLGGKNNLLNMLRKIAWIMKKPESERIRPTQMATDQGYLEYRIYTIYGKYSPTTYFTTKGFKVISSIVASYFPSDENDDDCQGLQPVLN